MAPKQRLTDHPRLYVGPERLARLGRTPRLGLLREAAE